MKTFDTLLIAYTAWLCRILAIGPAQLDKALTRKDQAFAPRPEGALGFYY
ncbi:MAG: hypothetical protein O2967_02140 [Proteobacteria bacterium]|nr:hypothetical protein [Pseudomonadota bacterium]